MPAAHGGLLRQFHFSPVSTKNTSGSGMFSAHPCHPFSGVSLDERSRTPWVRISSGISRLCSNSLNHHQRILRLPCGIPTISHSGVTIGHISFPQRETSHNRPPSLGCGLTYQRRFLLRVKGLRKLFAHCHNKGEKEKKGHGKQKSPERNTEPSRRPCYSSRSLLFFLSLQAIKTIFTEAAVHYPHQK